jgi:hypothetical protein
MATAVTVFFAACFLSGVGCFVAVHLIGLDILDRLAPGRSHVRRSPFPRYFDNQIDLYLKNRDPETQEWIQKKLDLRIRLSRLSAAALAACALLDACGPQASTASAADPIRISAPAPAPAPSPKSPSTPPPSALSDGAAAPPAPAASAPEASPSGVDSAATPTQLFEVEAGEAEELPSHSRVFFMMTEQLLTRPSDGLYEILDVRGRIGDARIIPERIRGYGHSDAPPLHAELSWIEPPARDPKGSMHVVAIGPLSSSLPRARLLRTALARAGLSSDIPDEAQSGQVPADLPVRYAVDLDGNDTPDLLSTYMRNLVPSAAPHRLRYHVSAKTLLRTAGSWREVEACDWTEEELVGP